MDPEQHLYILLNDLSQPAKVAMDRLRDWLSGISRKIADGTIPPGICLSLCRSSRMDDGSDSTFVADEPSSGWKMTSIVQDGTITSVSFHIIQDGVITSSPVYTLKEPK